jgi:hypothetical protein
LSNVDVPWRALLLFGTTAAGKSTSGQLVAHRVGFGCISADSVWKALMAATTPESHSAFHHFEPTPEVFARGPDHLAQLHVEQADAMTEPLSEFFDWEMRSRNRFVFEGAWITPELAARKTAQWNEARAVFIDEPEESEILAAMIERSGRAAQNLEPLPRQLHISAMAWRYGTWLRERTERLGLPGVPARPRETLVERILEAAGGIVSGE